MMIRAIVWDVWFSQQFRRYIDFIGFNVCMLPLYDHYGIIYAYSTQIMLLQRAVLRCFMLISLFFTSSKKEDNSSNRMGGLVWSSFQKVKRIDELEFS